MRKLPLKNQSFIYIENSFREWLDILGYAESTVYNLPNHIRELFYYLECHGHSNIKQLTPELIKAHYQTLKMRSNDRKGGALSNGSLNKHLQAFYKFTDYLRQSGKMLLPQLNIAWESCEDSEVETLTPEEIQLLYKATYGYNENGRLAPLNARDRAILTIFYGCGLRRNEGYHLDLSDINWERGTLHVRKGKANKERIVPFNKTNLNYLQDYVFDARPLLTKSNNVTAFFISERGTRLGANSMALRLKILQQRSDDIGLQEKNVRLHVLRHSIATHLLQNGMPLENISRFLGHTSLESTQIYTHLVDRSLGEG